MSDSHSSSGQPIVVGLQVIDLGGIRPSMVDSPCPVMSEWERAWILVNLLFDRRYADDVSTDLQRQLHQLLRLNATFVCSLC